MFKAPVYVSAFPFFAGKPPFSHGPPIFGELLKEATYVLVLATKSKNVLLC